MHHVYTYTEYNTMETILCEYNTIECYVLCYIHCDTLHINTQLAIQLVMVWLYTWY